MREISHNPAQLLIFDLRIGECCEPVAGLLSYMQSGECEKKRKGYELAQKEMKNVCFYR